MVDKKKKVVKKKVVKKKVVKNKVVKKAVPKSKKNEKLRSSTSTLVGNKSKKVAKKNTGQTGVTATKPKKNTGQTGVTATKPKGNKKPSTQLATIKPKGNKKPGTQLATIKPKGNKKPSTLKRLGNVAKRAVRSPVGKFGPLGAAVTGAYFLGEEFFPNKKKKPVVKKPVAKKKAPTKKRKLSPGESKIRKSDIMGGSKGRLSGPQGPLGGKLDKRKKSTVVKNRNKRFNPKKANRAGQKFGQR